MHILEGRQPAQTTARASDDRQQLRALAIFNRRARLVARNADRATDALRSAGLTLFTPEVRSRAEAAHLVRAHAGEVDLVIAAGGDGTLNAVLQGLIGTRLPLGILPLGTANDLCKTLDIPLDLEAACEVIARGNTRRIDVGRVNDTYYFLEASIGLSVALCRQLRGDAKTRLGVIAHALSAIPIMRRMRRFRAYVAAGDVPEVALNTAQLTFGNGARFGGLLASDEASIEDRKLDMYSVEFREWWTYFDALRALLRRRYDDVRTVVTMHARRFVVRTPRPMPIEADGEIVARTPAVFAALGGAVEVFAPEPARKDGG